MRKISLGYLNISDKGKEYVNDALNSNRLSRGKYTEKFEAEFARLHGCKHGVFLNSGTSALQVALAVLKEQYRYEDGDEVIVPAVTFIATSNIVIQNNLKPVFVDVDPRTFNIDPAKIEEKITDRTRAIIPVHLFGLAANMISIRRIARKHQLQILEDSCESMFSGIGDQSVGSFGDMAAFSTYVAHLIVGGVGGLITTNNDLLAEMARSSMAHGRDSIYTNIDQDDSEDANLLRSMIERRYSFERVGYSYRATELEAAIALSELERWQDNIYQRRENAEYLTKLLSDLDQLQLPLIPAHHTHSFMMYPINLVGDVNREEFLLYLEQRGIETRLMFPLLSQPIYRKLFPGLEFKYPIARSLTKNALFLGMHQGLGGEDIEYVSDVIHSYFKEK